MAIKPEDVEDDGFVVEEGGKVLNNEAMVKASRMYSLFEDYCNKINRKPEYVLGEELVRVIENDEYANVILDVDVDITKLNKDQFREDDLEIVRKLGEKFDLFGDDEENNENALDQMIMERIQSVGGGPLSSYGKKKKGNREIKEVKQRMARLEGMLSRQMEENENKNAENQRNRESVEDVFGDIDDGNNNNNSDNSNSNDESGDRNDGDRGSAERDKRNKENGEKDTENREEEEEEEGEMNDFRLNVGEENIVMEDEGGEEDG